MDRQTAAQTYAQSRGQTTGQTDEQTGRQMGTLIYYINILLIGVYTSHDEAGHYCT